MRFTSEVTKCCGQSSNNSLQVWPAGSECDLLCDLASRCTAIVTSGKWVWPVNVALHMLPPSESRVMNFLSHDSSRFAKVQTQDVNPEPLHHSGHSPTDRFTTLDSVCRYVGNSVIPQRELKLSKLSIRQVRRLVTCFTLPVSCCREPPPSRGLYLTWRNNYLGNKTTWNYICKSPFCFILQIWLAMILLSILHNLVQWGYMDSMVIGCRKDHHYIAVFRKVFKILFSLLGMDVFIVHVISWYVWSVGKYFTATRALSSLFTRTKCDTIHQDTLRCLPWWNNKLQFLKQWNMMT